MPIGDSIWRASSPARSARDARACSSNMPALPIERSDRAARTATGHTSSRCRARCTAASPEPVQPLQCEGGHRADRLVGALERLDRQAGRLGVDTHVGKRFEGGGADLGTRVVRPSRECRARPARAAHRERLRVVDQVRRVDLRQIEQEVLALGPERRERRQPAGRMQRRVVQPHDDRRKRGGVAQIRQRVQRRGADVGMRIVERGDDRRRVVAELEHAQRAKRDGAAPPEPAAQVPVGDRNERQGADDRTRADDASRVAIVDQRFEQQSGHGETVPRWGLHQPSDRRSSPARAPPTSGRYRSWRYSAPRRMSADTARSATTMAVIASTSLIDSHSSRRATTSTSGDVPGIVIRRHSRAGRYILAVLSVAS